MKFQTYRLQSEEVDPGAGGVAEAPVAETPAEAPAAPSALSSAETTTPEAPKTPDAKSALSTADEWSPGKVPEKFHVKSESGELDIAATLRKVEEHRSNLEKRLGAGGVRPKSADEYKLPDSFKDMQLDEAGAKAFREEAHEMGLSQAQYEKVMGKWMEFAPQLAAASKVATADDAISALTDVWKDNTKPQIAAAYGTAQKLAAKAGIDMATLDEAIGNNAVAIRLLAAIAPEMREDSTPAAANGAPGTGESITQLLAHPAYSNASHPEHAAISQKVRAYYERKESA